jgi:hypothetical protein
LNKNAFKRLQVIKSALEFSIKNNFSFFVHVTEQQIKFLITFSNSQIPAQYFDLYLDTNDDKLVVFDTQTFNADFDYQYDYIKNLFVPE